MAHYWHAHSLLEFFRPLVISGVDVFKLVIYMHFVYGSKCVVQHIICVVTSYGGGHLIRLLFTMQIDMSVVDLN